MTATEDRLQQHIEEWAYICYLLDDTVGHKFIERCQNPRDVTRLRLDAGGS